MFVRRIVLLAGLLLPSISVAQHPARHAGVADHGVASPFSQDMKAAMDRMHAGMMSVPETGNPNHDFMAQMIPHHQGAIDMAKAVLLTTKDPKIRNLAQSIITEQTYEIELMHSMLAQQGGSIAANPETSK